MTAAHKNKTNNNGPNTYDAYELNGISFGYNRKAILKDISLNIKEGEAVSIVGPNGAGKSTLLKLLARIYNPWQGTVKLNGKDILDYRQCDIAKIVAKVSQEMPEDFPFTVEETIGMGRAPYIKRFAVEIKEDREIIDKSMELTGTLKFKNRFPAELSGGERQKVMIAKALCQDPKILLLDEPTNHLDINCQLEINDLILRLQEEKNITTVYVTHDLNTASMYSRRVIMMKDGEVFSDGSVDEVLTVENIMKVYGVEVLIDDHPATGRPRITLQGFKGEPLR